MPTQEFLRKSAGGSFTVQWKKQAMIKSFQLGLRVGAAAIAFAASSGITPALSQTKQEHVHEMGQTVMPFDLRKVTHIFRMTDLGGVQSVVVKDARDKDQVELIRQHLRHEAEAFQHGDYADPTSLHGLTMPGVSELAGHHEEITVSYSELPLGAAITFENSGPTFGDGGSPLVWRPVVGARCGCEARVISRVRRFQWGIVGADGLFYCRADNAIAADDEQNRPIDADSG